MPYKDPNSEAARASAAACRARYLAKDKIRRKSDPEYILRCQEYEKARTAKRKGDPSLMEQFKERTKKYREAHKKEHRESSLKNYNKKKDTLAFRRAQRLRSWKQKAGIKFLDDTEAQMWLDRAFSPDCRCEVTGITNEENMARFGFPLPLDHDHVTGRPRRFLASHVNLMMGMMESLSGTEILTIVALTERDRKPE
jgi:hypothetical protein